MEYRDFLIDDTLEVTVWDKGMLGSDFMGEVLLKRTEIKHGSTIWYTLADRDRRAEALPGQDRNSNNHDVTNKLAQDLTKGRSKVKDIVRGKRNVVGELRLSFETVY